MKLKQIMTVGLSAAMILSALPGETIVFADAEQDAVVDVADEFTDEEDTENEETDIADTEIVTEEAETEEVEVPDFAEEETDTAVTENADTDESEELFSDSAEEAGDSSVYDSGSLSDTINWTLYNDGRLVIEGTGSIPAASELAAAENYRWALEKEKVTSVEIGEGITSIGNETFMNHSNITSVTLPTTLIRIWNSAFEGCAGITSVRIPGTAAKTSIGTQAFRGCVNLKQIVTEGSLTGISNYAFQDCSSLESVSMVNGALMIAEGAFQNCIKLKQIFSADNSGVRFLGDVGKYAFSGCSSLESIKISENSAAISTAAFDGCTSLQSVVISDGVKTIYDSAFHNCTGIQTIKIPGTVESLGGQAFAGCTGLKEVVIEDGTALLGIKKGAFAGCRSLEKITIPKRAFFEEKAFTDFDSIKTIRYTGSRSEAITAGLNKYDFYNADIYYDYKEKHEHKFVTYTYRYTDSCTEPGTEIIKCKICGQVRSEKQVPAQGHAWKVVSEKKATCKAKGVRNLKCSRCGATTQSTIPVAAHKFSAWKTTTAATVFSPAVQTRTCSTCGRKENRKYGKKLNATIKVNVTSIPLKVKQKTTIFRVSGLARGDSIASWRSSNTNIVKVSGRSNGTCTLAAGSRSGRATVTVTLKSGLRKNVTVTVQKSAVKTSKISGVSRSLRLKRNQTATLKPVVTPLTSLQKVTYTSSNKNVATVTSKGVVKAKKKGTAVITVKSGSKSVKCTVTVR